MVNITKQVLGQSLEYHLNDCLKEKIATTYWRSPFSLLILSSLLMQMVHFIIISLYISSFPSMTTPHSSHPPPP